MADLGADVHIKHNNFLVRIYIRRSLKNNRRRTYNY